MAAAQRQQDAAGLAQQALAQHAPRHVSPQQPLPQQQLSQAHCVQQAHAALAVVPPAWAKPPRPSSAATAASRPA
jgi:hypothetical protein